MLERAAAAEQMVVRLERVGEDELARSIGEAQPAEPVAVSERPGLARPWVGDLASQAELRDSVAYTHQVDAHVFTGAYQVAQLLLLDRRYPH